MNCNYTGDAIPLAEKVGAFVDYDSFCIRPMGPGLVTKTGDPMFPKGQMAEAMLRSPYALAIDDRADGTPANHPAPALPPRTAPMW